MNKGLSRFNVVSLTLGFAFLYIPIVILVVYSFNASVILRRQRMTTPFSCTRHHTP